MARPKKYVLEATGTQYARLDPIVYRVASQFTKKNRYFEDRQTQVESIARVMEVLVPIGQEVNEAYSAKSIREVDDYYFASALLHQAWNFLQGIKLAPDYVDFSPDITMQPDKGVQQARSITQIVDLARRKGDYEKAMTEAQRDLIRGECYIYRDYSPTDDGADKQLEYKNIPWNNVRQQYDDTDLMIISDMTADEYAMIYGKEALKKVTYGSVIDAEQLKGKIDTSTTQQYLQRTQNLIQVVVYFDPAQKVFCEIHGGNAFLYKKLEGKDYPFVDSSGDAFVPVYRRIFYAPTQGYHGWGPLDLLLPVTRLATTIVNATANRSVLAADPLTVLASNDPEEAKRQWYQHKNNRSLGEGRPFFVSDNNTGTKITPQVTDIGVDNSNFQIWSDYLLNEATIRTGIDFRSMTDYAPTAEQQRLRKQEQDRVNTSVLFLNRDTDKAMAREDIYLLQTRTSEFHKLTVYLDRTPESFTELGEEEIAALRDLKGNLPKKETTIAEFIDTLEDVEFNISPRLDGVLDDQSFTEIMATKDDIMLLPPGSMGQSKAITQYFQAAHPKMNILLDEVMPPAPEAPLPPTQ